MGNQTDYFERIGYQPKYRMGDRVTGLWNKIPFVGTVGNDTQISEVEGPYVNVHLDLPLKFKDTYYTFLKLKHRDVKSYK